MLLRLTGAGPLHRRVYDVLRARILSGELAAGARLPSTRALAQDNGIARITADRAYDQLAAEGYVEMRRGAGTFVAMDVEGAPPPAGRRGAESGRVRVARVGARVLETLPLLSSRGHDRARPRFDFRHGAPSVAEFPHAVWRRLLGRHARRLDVPVYDYPPAAGVPALREAIAGYLRRARGVAVDAAQVLVVNGSQQGIDLTARLLLDPGDTALVEEPGYEGARSAFRLAGARLLPVRVDGDGLDLASAPPTARKARVVHVTPSHQYPLGSVLSLPRRLALLDWANRTGAWIVEDDYDGEFRFDGRPLAPLKALDDGDRVVFVGTFSKVMFPALRLGCLVVPRALARTFARAKALADGGTSQLEQATLADFIASGAFERHVRRARLKSRERRGVLLDGIARLLGDRVEVVGTNAGLHVVLRFPGRTPADVEAIAAAARARDVGVYAITPYYLRRPPRDGALVLGYGGLAPDAIAEGVRRLAAVVLGRR